MACQCGKAEHEPWCAEFVAGVDTRQKVPVERRHRQAAERAVSDTLHRLATRLGPEEFENVAMAYLLSREPFLRANRPPDHPALQLLDEWRRQGRIT